MGALMIKAFAVLGMLVVAALLGRLILETLSGGWPFKRKPRPPQMVTVNPDGSREVNLKMLLESPGVRAQLRQAEKIREALVRRQKAKPPAPPR